VPPQLIGLRGALASQSIQLGAAPMTFGRNPDNTIVLATGRASRRHAEIRPEGADYILTDLGSANGTFVNGQRLTAPHRLRPGDTFDIGDDSFRFDAPPALDKTIVVAPAAVRPYQPPAPAEFGALPAAPHQPVPGASQGLLPATPALAAEPPKRRGIGRTLLIVLGVLGLVFVAACIGGAMLISRGAASIISSGQTSVAVGTPRPTAASGAAATAIPAGDSGSTSADWTVLVYLDGDNNLERDAVADFNEMEQAGSTDKVNVVVQFDRVRSNGPEDDSSNGDWDTTKRFLIAQDGDKRKMASQELEDLGEQNMGDPQTLVDFITWGLKEYPAKRYALVVWDHGSSWAGVAFDDTSEKKGITLPELDAALRTATNQANLEKLDLIGFDACLMAQIDVLHTISPYARVAVASAELEPNDGWAWDTWLKQLDENPAQEPAALATAIVDAYHQYYEGSKDDTVTLSAFDLEKIGQVHDGLGVLSDAMLKDLGSAYQSIAQARSSVDAYSQPKTETFSAVDLGDFARLVGRQGAQGQVAATAKSLEALIAEARIAEWHGTFHDRSTGMSVFFPQVKELYPDFYEQASPMTQSTSWSSFLKEFYNAGTQQVSAPAIGDLQLSSPTVGFGNPATLQGSVSGKGIGFIFSFIGIPNADRSGVELTNVDYIYPPGAAPNGEVPDWEDGSYNLTSTWDGTRWAISNGTDTIPVLLGPTKYGTDLYGVEGTYIAQGSGEQIAAGLLFEVGQGSAQLLRIYGFPKGQRAETQPFEIAPTPGDSFTALLRTYTIKDGRPVPDFNPGETITFGDQPLTALRVPANSGAYVAGFLVRDIAGHFSYEYKDITVDNSGAGQVDPQAQEQPTAGPGTQSGTLAFNSAEGKFTLEYPAAWQTLDTGKSQVYFYDPAESSKTYISVEYLSVKQAPAAANAALLKAYEDILAKEQDFVRGESGDVDLAGQTGQAFKYTYTDKDGNALSGAAVVVTSPNTGLSYVLTVQSLATDFERETGIFNKVLDSFKIE
jgi:hypothetical protein